MKLENHSGIVDNYRNPKGDIETLAYYNRPLYLAVKMDRKSFERRRHDYYRHIHRQ